MVVDIKSHPRDLNYILVAYDGGVALWNFSKKAVERTYDLLLPPGAVGGSDEQDPNLFSDRRPNVTCLAWRPDALVFCVGHEDGCLSFWDVQDGDKPLQVRTMDRTDVNSASDRAGFSDLVLIKLDVAVANAEQLFAASESSDSANPPAFRQPIFALTWSGFSEEGFLDKWSSSVRTAAGSGPVIPKTSEDSDAESPGITALTILGGLLPNDAIGIHCLVFKVAPFTFILDAGFRLTVVLAI